MRDVPPLHLPNADAVVVAEAKITRYLLDPTDPRNQQKHRFWLGLGYTDARWDALADALKEHARTQRVTGVRTDQYGTRYTVEGPLHAPDGTTPVVESVWQIDAGGGLLVSSAHIG